MPAPSSATYSVATRTAAHTAFRDLLDAGSGPGFLRIRSSSDVLLAELTLKDPSGTVNGTTGQLTFDLTGGVQDLLANATGTAAYGEFTDSAGLVHLALPTQTGTTAVSGFLVMNTLSLVINTPVVLVSATVG
jgi:hypothetical protein